MNPAGHRKAGIDAFKMLTSFVPSPSLRKRGTVEKGLRIWSRIIDYDYSKIRKNKRQTRGGFVAQGTYFAVITYLQNLTGGGVAAHSERCSGRNEFWQEWYGMNPRM